MSRLAETTPSKRPLATGGPPREFFIVGCPRSGTTLLRFMLDAHPEIAVTPETHFAERHLRIGDRSRGRVRSAAAARAAAVDSFCEADVFERMQIDEDWFRAATSSGPDDPWRPLRIAMHVLARRRRVPIVGEKTPSHALHWRALSSAFPRARFLLVLRDPRGVAASWMRTSWSKQTSTEIAEKWRRSVRSMRDARRSLGGRCLEVRYEDLVADPAGVLGPVCSLLGSRFDGQMLRFHERVRIVEADGLPADEGTDNPRIFDPIDPMRAEAWRHELAFQDRCRVESVCGRSMVEMGYRPDTPRHRRLAQSLAISPRLLGRRLRRRLRELDAPRFASPGPR